MQTYSQDNLQSLSLPERDVLRCFWRSRHEGRSPHVSDIRQALNCRHSAHIPGIVVSLIRKGYLRDTAHASPVARATGREVAHGRA